MSIPAEVNGNPSCTTRLVRIECAGNRLFHATRGGQVITLLLSTGAFWIFPVLVFGWVVHKPADVMWRDYFAAARPRFRRGRVHLNTLCIVVLLISIDTACTMAFWGRDFASVCILADLAVVGLTALVASVIALSPRQCVVTVVFFASLAMITIWSLLRGFVL
jgi:hypothetical protein